MKGKRLREREGHLRAHVQKRNGNECAHLSIWLSTPPPCLLLQPPSAHLRSRDIILSMSSDS